MAIPIRLNIGQTGASQIELKAQSFDVSVDRNVSTFPTPFTGDMKRFAVDTNIPRVEIEISGIIEDDVAPLAGAAAELESKAANIIDFTRVLPINAADYENLPRQALDGNGTPFESKQFIVKRDYEEGEATIINVRGNANGIAPGTFNLGLNFNNALVDTLWKTTSAYTAGATDTISVEFTDEEISAGRIESGRVDVASVFLENMVITNEAGDSIGRVQSTTANTITFTAPIGNDIGAGEELQRRARIFNRFGQEIGIVTSTVGVATNTDNKIHLSAGNAVPLKDGETIHYGAVPPLEEVLGKPGIFLKFSPSYWVEQPNRSALGQTYPLDGGIGRSTTGGHQGIRFYFDADNPYTDPPFIYRIANRNSTNSSGGADGIDYDAAIDIPIKGIYDADNPAAKLAERVEDAFKLTGAVTISTNPLEPNGGTNLPAAFNVTRSGAMLVIEQTYVPDVVIKDYSPFSTKLIELFDIRAAAIANSKVKVNAQKSAGDRVQDIMGLMADSAADSESVIRGIQIPYDSLITSSGVTGVARNFFLTFGEIDIDSKGAKANTLSASHTFENLSLNKSDTGGEIQGDSLESFFGKLLSGEIIDAVRSVGGWAKNVMTDLWVTLTTDGHGNDGGIRIIPEKLHVRYDAGHQYYAFNLKLVASDFVVGV
tara:strand:+ start:2792 stop:4762 length:1971 start_codon:yes stop_codon:yes gene_type:complete